MEHRLDDTGLYYFNRGQSAQAYKMLGCHPATGEYGERVYRFAVWAPNARRVSVVGMFNAWDTEADVMTRQGDTGVFVAQLGFAKPGQLYKYAIVTQSGEMIFKADPYAFSCESHGTASIVSELPDFAWTDGDYERNKPDRYARPMSIYEVHPGSWKKGLSYRELGDQLVDYAADMGYTHIELMPVTEYPYDGSWGYQVTGFFAPTGRFGTAEELMYFVNRAHEKGIGLILDWVPAHFPKDAHGLRLFDGTPLYEHHDPRRAEMPQWGTLLFDFSCEQVQSFLLSSAHFWLNEYHFDGIRVDAVSAMLYLDFGKEPGEWLPNQYGGRENTDAVTFFKKLSRTVSELPAQKLLFAEESSAYPYVTRSPEEGGLGFSYKWNMGWMNDVLSYMEMDSLFRKWHHDKLTFSLCYAFSEHYILPFSHDEVVHGKKSMLSKMPGDYWQQFAQLRLLFAYQFAHPGKKLMFMGDEFGQFIEWRYYESLDWLLLGYEMHKKMQSYVRALNHTYTAHAALYENDTNWEGFQWSNANDNIHSVVSFFRRDNSGNTLLCVFNFTPEPWESYVTGVPEPGTFREIFSTDSRAFGGTGDYENAPAATAELPYGEYDRQVTLRIPPYAGIYLQFEKLEQEG